MYCRDKSFLLNISVQPFYAARWLGSIQNYGLRLRTVDVSQYRCHSVTKTLHVMFCVIQRYDVWMWTEARKLHQLLSLTYSVGPSPFGCPFCLEYLRLCGHILLKTLALYKPFTYLLTYLLILETWFFCEYLWKMINWGIAKLILNSYVFKF